MFYRKATSSVGFLCCVAPHVWHMFQGYELYMLQSIVEVIKTYVMGIPWFPIQRVCHSDWSTWQVYTRNATERKAINLFNITIKDIVRELSI